MNQNIKFRAWDDKDKQMLYPDLFSSSWSTKSSKGEISDIPSIMTWDGNIYLAVESDDGFTKYKKQDQIILLQYTRSKDKNGKEIYQGDIIKETYASPDGSVEDTYRVVINVILTNDITTFPAEIVGNIYENPELAITLAGKIK
jgi:uncharacterized phage protein (TIGR01671 family)